MTPPPPTLPAEYDASAVPLDRIVVHVPLLGITFELRPIDFAWYLGGLLWQTRTPAAFADTIGRNLWAQR